MVGRQNDARKRLVASFGKEAAVELKPFREASLSREAQLLIRHAT